MDELAQKRASVQMTAREGGGIGERPEAGDVRPVIRLSSNDTDEGGRLTEVTPK